MITHKNYLLYLSGLFISLFGSFIYTFAIGLYVLNLTGSPLLFANNLIIGILPTVILGPFVGVFVDNTNKKKVIIIADILNGLLFLALFLASRYNLLSLSIIYITTFLINIITCIFDNGMTASKVLIFKKDHLPKINAKSQIIRSLSIITAPVLGGLVFSYIHISFFILLNALSFLVSAFIEMFLSFPVQQKTKALTLEETRLNLVEGLVYLKNKQTFHPIILYFVMLNFVLGLSINVPIPYIINNILKAPTNYLGIIQGCFPVGLLLADSLLKKLWKDTLTVILYFLPIQ